MTMMDGGGGTTIRFLTALCASAVRSKAFQKDRFARSRTCGTRHRCTGHALPWRPQKHHAPCDGAWCFQGAALRGLRHQEQCVPQTTTPREAHTPTRRQVTGRATRGLSLLLRVRPDILPRMPPSRTIPAPACACTTYSRQRRACTRAQTLQSSSEHRVSTKQALGTMPDIVFHQPVQREAAGAAVCVEEALRWLHTVERPGGAPAQVGALQQQRRPPTAEPTADRHGRQPASAPGGDGTEESDGGGV